MAAACDPGGKVRVLAIRKEQMDSFRQSALLRFEEEMLIHLEEFSPPLFKTVGAASMREVIRFGMGRADSYGFNFRGPVQLYLELMLLFGSHFDTDPQYPWVGEVLGNRDTGSQMQRADWLYEQTMVYRKEVTGPEDAYALEALRNIQIFARRPLDISPNSFVHGMLREIAQIYPQKAAYIGRTALVTLIHEGLDRAKRQAFTTVRGAALVIVLMLAFGHGCAYDPLYPWIANTLKEDSIADPEAKAQRLERKALIWLEHALAHFDEKVQA